MDLNRILYNIGTLGASEGAIKEALASQMPGRENGPADAYRHILLAAELTRRFGEDIARQILDYHEQTGNSDGQTADAEAMDRRNNEIGIEIGKGSTDWGDVVSKSRKEFGDDGRATWLPPEKWGTNPKDADGNRMPNDDPRLNWPPKWPTDGKPYPDVDYKPGDGNYRDMPPEGDPFTGLPWPNTIIEDIKKKYDKASVIPSPVVLDLDGDGVETTSLTAGAYFDHASDGFAEQTAWVGKDDGLLVRDRNGNGTIDNGNELFGSETILNNGQRAANGFVALQELDQNADGKIDAADADFATLRVWKDGNGNGRTDAGELLSLADAGVQSIGVGFTNSSMVDANKNEHRQVGQYTTLSGLTQAATDVWFVTDTTYGMATATVAESYDVLALPEVMGFGKVSNLRQAMMRDGSGTLKNLVTQFTQATSNSERLALINPIIYKWAGVENVDPTSRAATQIYGNVIGDARKLEALEEFMGREWYGTWCWGTRDPNPHGNAAPVLLQAYGELSELVYSQLAIQSFLKPLYDKVDFHWNATSNSIEVDLSGVAAQITADINVNRSAGKELLSEFMRTLRGVDALSSIDATTFAGYLTPLGADVYSIVNNAAFPTGATEGSDQLTGDAGANTLFGLGGNDTLTGNGGNDLMDGGNGDDVLYGDAGADYLAGGRGNDQLYGGTGVDTYYFGRGDGRDTIHEDYLDDTWIFIGDLTIEELTFRRSGADLVVGFQTSTSDNIVLADFFVNGEPQSNLVLKKENGESQVLDATALIQMTLVATEGADVLNGSSAADTINALGGDDLVFARAGNDTVDGGAGNDNVNGGDGDDQLSGGTGNDTLRGDIGSDVLQGGDGHDRLLGEAGNDTLAGQAGDDWLDGGTGADSMSGGAGNDTYVVDNSADTVTESVNEGVDQVRTSVSLTLSANVENATLLGSSDLSATGNSSANVLMGNQGANTLTGLAGNDELQAAEGHDTLDGGDDQDTLYGGSGNDVLLGGNGNDHLFGQTDDDQLDGGAGNDLLEGNEGRDQLIGGAGNDLLDGGAGQDTMAGGLGDDAYIVDDIGDLVMENAGEGIETVNSAVSFTLSDNVEHLLLVGYDNTNATGNAESNELIGNIGNNQIRGLDGHDTLKGEDGDDSLEGGAGNDILDGGTGIDTLAGGIGDDVYDIDRAEDTVVELGNQGLDTIRSSTSYTLSANVENLILQTEGGYIDGRGNAMANHLTGNEYNNRLDGAEGADTLEGLGGDDTYVVDTPDDVIIEAYDGGYDTVETTLNYTLGDNLEALHLQGATDANGSGNDSDNTLIGNAGANTLNGGAGSDWLEGNEGDDVLDGGTDSDAMAGGVGNDTYLTDTQGDRIDENADEGIDTEIRSFETAYLLSQGVENLTLTGTIYRGNGNELNNVITGNEAENNLWGMYGNDTLIGGGGNDALFGDIGQDVLIGGTGDDYYEIDDAGDVITELANEGDDFVRSTVSWTLGANLERLAVDGDSDLSVTGNALDNGLWGNNGANILTGGKGNDYLDGGAGNDTYVFNKGDGQDSIDTTDLSTAVDTLRIGALDSEVLGFQYGAHLFLKIKNSSDQIGFINYYAAGGTTGGQTYDQKIDRIEFSNGVVWDQAMIQSVVDRANNNHAPTVSGSIPALTARQGSAFSYTIPVNTITDPDAWDSITYSVKMQDGSSVPAWLSFDPTTRVLSGTPAAANLGTLQFILWGTDNYGYAAGTYVNLTVKGPNTAPVLANALPDLTASEGAAFTYTVASNAFTDPDAGDTLTYRATLADGNALPSWLSFNASTRAFTGTPPAGSSGTVSIRVYATDTGNLAASDVFNLTVSVANLSKTGTSAAEVLAGAGGNDTLSGAAGNDTLYGYGGNDLLDGGTNADSLVGGAGNDTYIVDATTDVVVENANEGTDLIQSSVTYTLSANVENLTLTGTSAINATGNAADNVLTGNSAANTLTGGGGNDTLIGGAGNDNMAGGTGDDTYVVDVTTDVITENAGEGTDTIQSAITFTLASLTNVENLTLTGTSAVNATGNAAANVLTGNSAANTLNGGTGADTMLGGAGNDSYVVDHTGDTVIENAGEGTDTVSASVTYTLSAQVENLTLTGTTAINGTGNALANVLTGNSAANNLSGGDGDDTLSGGAGADVMSGGLGNDTFVVDNTADVVTEGAGEGSDLVQSSVTYTLSANVEKLTLTGTSAINGTGNALDNQLTGNAAINTLTGGVGNDTLDGGAGADSLVGGTGNDLYIVDNTSDKITENANEGTDTVQSTVTWTLGSNLENLTLTGTSAINGTGNTGDNWLIGNGAINTLTGGTGNDTLDGGVGADSLVGGAGNDVYLVDNTSDKVVENASEGTDTVQSSVTWTLGSNLENLTLIGTTAINGTGNTLANVLTGNSAANTLTGGGGNDSYRGGQGNDTLTASVSTSNDVYIWGRGEGADTLSDAGGTDQLQILAGVTADQVWLRHVGNNLEISVIGGTDSFTISNWYTSSANQVESFKLADGKALQAANVQKLVDAMASLAPPAAGQTTLPTTYQTALNPVITANWV